MSDTVITATEGPPPNMSDVNISPQLPTTVYALLTVAGGAITVTSQTGQVASATYSSAGRYLVTLLSLFGITDQRQVIPNITSFANATIVPSVTVAMVDGQAVLSIILEDAGTPTDASFYLSVGFASVPG
jgi:hypothetical protein